ncbi:protein-arginine deiminase domain-containing protein [Amycolatopsis jejuensis]|uniref:protein-arginine deiminase domain-containing protein n=1 Tax=Amycolatopsis jejuensis TaxID=330084 RepID=UPI000527CDAD|nr:protein-arginine deiminase domain-containing protein [Amycolatopsis jejuensis]
MKKTALVPLLVITTASGLATPAAADPRPLTADVRADVNRDGVVDLAGPSDSVGKKTWTTQRGAIFLPNIGDSERRCPSTDSAGKPLPDDKLAACNDASDDVARATENLAPVKTVPIPHAPQDAVAQVAVTGAGKEKTRLFVHRDGKWVKLTGPLTPAELRGGATLGIDAKDVIRDTAVWDGSATVQFTVAHGGRSTSDSVVLRVAPVLTHHHLQQAQEVLVTDNDRPEQQRFVKELAEQVRAAGLTAPLRRFDGDDRWAQDFVEPGYVTMPGPDGKPKGLRIAIRSAQAEREAGRQVFTKLRGPGIGAVQIAGGSDNSVNSTGNLETIPPHHGFPAGRIIIGTQGKPEETPSPEMLTFLRSQGLQSPLVLDTSWLAVGHVDEFVQFLPRAGGRGWTIAVADPESGLKVLRDAQRQGHGSVRMFSRPGSTRNETVDQVLANRKVLDGNALAQRRIKANLELLQRETGVTDGEIVKVPVLFRDFEPSDIDQSRGKPKVPPDQMPEGLVAYVPNAVNGVVLNSQHYLSARQWGPMIGGKDIFTEAVNTAYGKAGFTVHDVDDWDSHHTRGGEVHCGTNTFREQTSWWPR